MRRNVFPSRVVVFPRTRTWRPMRPLPCRTALPAGVCRLVSAISLWSAPRPRLGLWADQRDMAHSSGVRKATLAHKGVGLVLLWVVLQVFR